jgi:hypothetical protein
MLQLMANHNWSALAADSKKLVELSGGLTLLLKVEAMTNHSSTKP